MAVLRVVVEVLAVVEVPAGIAALDIDDFIDVLVEQRGLVSLEGGSLDFAEGGGSSDGCVLVGEGIGNEAELGLEVGVGRCAEVEQRGVQVGLLDGDGARCGIDGGRNLLLRVEVRAGLSHIEGVGGRDVEPEVHAGEMDDDGVAIGGKGGARHVAQRLRGDIVGVIDSYDIVVRAGPRQQPHDGNQCYRNKFFHIRNC